jgi:acetylglutamate kinase
MSLDEKRPILIKYGGSLLEDPAHQDAFLAQVSDLSRREKVILVHGGGKEITHAMAEAGIVARFVQGRRFTDEATMAVVERVLSEINRRIVQSLLQKGVNAEGFSGRHRGLVKARAIPELGHVGEPIGVNQKAFEHLVSQSALPVFYSVAEDRTGSALNINADDFALALAVACRAQRLVYLTDTGGVLDPDGRLLESLTPLDVDALAEKKVITGGMLVKARACVSALNQGVGRVDIVKGIRYLLESGSSSAEGTVFIHGH